MIDKLSAEFLDHLLCFFYLGMINIHRIRINYHEKFLPRKHQFSPQDDILIVW